ncbi:hypothetical protein NQZ68_005370 [Dissostichus eleginoides]|nr:hypothetical protein NQZ68_005370 [Dissostichus eleginoides]
MHSADPFTGPEYLGNSLGWNTWYITIGVDIKPVQNFSQLEDNETASAVFCYGTRRMVFVLHVIVMSSAFFNPSFAFSSHLAFMNPPDVGVMGKRTQVLLQCYGTTEQEVMAVLCGGLN